MSDTEFAFGSNDEWMFWAVLSCKFGTATWNYKLPWCWWRFTSNQRSGHSS